MGQRRRKQIYHLSFLGALFLIAFSFQNCAKVQFREAASEVKILSCDSHENGSSWWQLTDHIIEEPVICEFGGDLVLRFEQEEEVSCNEGNYIKTGNTRKGKALEPRGRCNPPTCNGRPNLSVWDVVQGVIREPESCPSSSTVIYKNYEKVVTYKCDNGTTTKLSEKKGNYINTDGTCPAPNLTVNFSPTAVAAGGTSNLLVTTANVSTVTYSCGNGASGTLPLTNSSTAITAASSSVTCTVRGVNSANQEVVKSATLAIIGCQSFQQLSGSSFDVPARNGSGICYYTKLFDAIENSGSTGDRDPYVVASDHDDNSGDANPYVLGDASRSFKLLGARNVKLSASIQSLTSIKVDNFLILELNSSQGYSQQAFGTSDSAIPGTNYVHSNGVYVTLNSAGFSGTATVAPLNLTSSFSVGPQFNLRLKALDCGSIRELSDVYLVFE